MCVCSCVVHVLLFVVGYFFFFFFLICGLIIYRINIASTTAIVLFVGQPVLPLLLQTKLQWASDIHKIICLYMRSLLFVVPFTSQHKKNWRIGNADGVHISYVGNLRFPSFQKFLIL